MLFSASFIICCETQSVINYIILLERGVNLGTFHHSQQINMTSYAPGRGGRGGYGSPRATPGDFAPGHKQAKKSAPDGLIMLDQSGKNI